MNSKLTLDLDALAVTTFETDSGSPANGAATVGVACGGTGCNTRNTCSTNLC